MLWTANHALANQADRGSVRWVVVATVNVDRDALIRAAREAASMPMRPIRAFMSARRWRLPMVR